MGSKMLLAAATLLAAAGLASGAIAACVFGVGNCRGLKTGEDESTATNTEAKCKDWCTANHAFATCAEFEIEAESKTPDESESTLDAATTEHTCKCHLANIAIPANCVPNFCPNGNLQLRSCQVCMSNNAPQAGDSFGFADDEVDTDFATPTTAATWKAETKCGSPLDDANKTPEENTALDVAAEDAARLTRTAGGTGNRAACYTACQAMTGVTCCHWRSTTEYADHGSRTVKANNPEIQCEGWASTRGVQWEKRTTFCHGGSRASNPAVPGTCGAAFDCSAQATNKQANAAASVTADTPGTAAECCGPPTAAPTAAAATPAVTSAAVRVTTGLAAVLALLALVA